MLSDGAGAISQPRGRRRDGAVSGIGRGVRQARRRRVGGRRHDRASRPRPHAARDRDARARRFYTGWIADSIAATMAANGGLITKKDLAAYQAKVRAPIRGTYRGYEIDHACRRRAAAAWR